MLSRLGVRRMPGSIAFPSAPPLAPPTPRTVARLCSPASSLLWKGLTSHRPCITGFGPPAFPVRTVLRTRRPAMRSPGSRTRRFRRVPGSQTTRDRQGLAITHPPCCLPLHRQRRHPGQRAFAAQYLAHRHPLSTLRPCASRPATHDSGPMWFALPFIVRDFHPLLLAGLPAHPWPPWSSPSSSVLRFFLACGRHHVSPVAGSNSGFKRLRCLIEVARLTAWRKRHSLPLRVVYAARDNVEPSQK